MFPHAQHRPYSRAFPQHGTTPEPTGCLNPLFGNGSGGGGGHHHDGAVLAMCGACGGVLENYAQELADMEAMRESGDLSTSGSKALWDEVRVSWRQLRRLQHLSLRAPVEHSSLNEFQQ